MVELEVGDAGEVLIAANDCEIVGKGRSGNQEVIIRDEQPLGAKIGACLTVLAGDGKVWGDKVDGLGEVIKLGDASRGIGLG